MNTPDTPFDEYMKSIIGQVSKTGQSINRIHLACPFPYIHSLVPYQSEICRIGSQDIHHEKNGAFSSSVSSVMIADCGASFTLIGHSETRHGLTINHIKQKITNALSSDLDVYYCFGEDSQISDVTNRMNCIMEQLNVLDSFMDDNGDKIKLCYEPVWSIGTGIIPSGNDVQHVVDAIRLEPKFHQSQLFYGGSVTTETMPEFRDVNGLCGLLVGGASLKLSKLIQML